MEQLLEQPAGAKHSPPPPLYLKKQEERRIRAGHLWVFSNEVDSARSPLARFMPGEQVELRDSRDRVLGLAYVNPHTLICARLFSRRGQRLNRDLILVRLRRALAVRRRRYANDCYRLVFGEGDGLPGLVIDRFGDTCVIQITTAGMERMKDDIVAALDALLHPAHVVLRNDTGIRLLEGLPLYEETLHGNPPDCVTVVENGARFCINPLAGQKTGWYYDHRDNRARLAPYVKDARVLDVFSYSGAWGIQAALAGAREVLCVDESRPALAQARHNAEHNGVADRLDTVAGDAFSVLKALREEGRRFDVVVVDPPAFVKRKKDLAAGMEAYRRINQLAMQLLDDDGILVSASCSYHMKTDNLLAVLRQAARNCGCGLQVLEQGHQGADHPVHPAIPETNYLKTFFCRIVPPL
ncbi:MAG TPA: class I SAM-dependent rRNA methyltransferase [Anaerolineae bacterium]|nr:class I SAM-dependent rRNA methyltransferase [Anaerolineae bacterium]